MFLRLRFGYCPACDARIALNKPVCRVCGEPDPFGLQQKKEERQFVLFLLVLVVLFTWSVLQYTGIISLDLLSSVFSDR
jgi:predicted nucleic acid-binding Zn ribbon protein